MSVAIKNDIPLVPRQRRKIHGFNAPVVTPMPMKMSNYKKAQTQDIRALMGHSQLLYVRE
jgi:hypothetical protein